MKRNEMVKTLLKEGFSEKTLVGFSDKQLSDLHVRLFGESITNVASTDIKTQDELRKKKLPFQVYSEEKPSAGLSKEKKSEVVKKAKKGEDIGKKGKSFKDIEKKAKESGADDPKAVAAAAMWKNVKRENVEVKSWLENIAEENFHSMTSKGEIMELIQTKLNEVEVGPNVKKGHNGVPEFMSYDAISNTEVAEQSPTTKPAPTKPKVDPGTKPRTPYSPKPGEKSKPKALKEKKNANK